MFKNITMQLFFDKKFHFVKLFLKIIAKENTAAFVRSVKKHM